MKVLVGLGNPGAKYEGHRHNVGFMAIDAIARRYNAGPWKRRFQGAAAEVDIGRVRYLLLKPATYMNESGRSVGEAIRFYKMSPADVIVFHDELDLEPGKLRVKFGGGHAGHNGLKSLSAHIGNDYQRVRIGIGHPGHRDAVSGYVLHDFSSADRTWLEPLLESIAQAVPSLVAGQDARFLNDVSRVGRPDKKAGKGARSAAPAQPTLPEPASAVAAVVAERVEAPKPAPVPPASASQPAPAVAAQPATAPKPEQLKQKEPAMAGTSRPGKAKETSLGAKLAAWLRRA
jgi:PTH1 family peptidyl-tRNA hydrolase